MRSIDEEEVLVKFTYKEVIALKEELSHSYVSSLDARTAYDKIAIAINNHKIAAAQQSNDLAK